MFSLLSRDTGCLEVSLSLTPFSHVFQTLTPFIEILSIITKSVTNENLLYTSGNAAHIL